MRAGYPSKFGGSFSTPRRFEATPASHLRELHWTALKLVRVPSPVFQWYMS